MKKLFGNKKISHILPFTKPVYEETVIEKAERLSISGVQPKFSLKLNGKILDLTESGGEFILKPHPNATMKNVLQVPANEHLTMQIASQVFKIKTAENAIVFFEDSYEPCYLTKRFDRNSDGSKIAMEDFAQIAGKTEETEGAGYKYNSTYEDIAGLLRKYCGAYNIEIEKFFRIIVFNFLVNNGDAHLKNFSLRRNEKFGDYLMTPAYDLLNTRIHFPKDGEMPMPLFKDGYESESYKVNLHYLYQDFYEFGIRIGIKENRVKKFLTETVSKYDEIEALVNRSFLSDDIKKLYLDNVQLSIKKLQL
ncbi:MAG: HipA domain-containing protein [Ignavibacteria bacterium]|nr:HipA domain-containing protein [Ignavibacteria bacterium]